MRVIDEQIILYILIEGTLLLIWCSLLRRGKSNDFLQPFIASHIVEQADGQCDNGEIVVGLGVALFLEGSPILDRNEHDQQIGDAQVYGELPHDLLGHQGKTR